MREVALDHVNVVEVGGVLRRGVDRRTEVDPYDLLGAKGRCQAQVSALSAARVKNATPDKGVAADGRDPAEHLLLVLRADLREAHPLVAEPRGRRDRLGGERGRKHPRDPPRDRVARTAGAARKLALADVVSLRHRARQGDRALTGGAGEPVEEPPLHAGWYREAQSWKARRV